MSDDSEWNQHNRAVELLLKVLKGSEYDSVDDLFAAALSLAEREGDTSVSDGILAEAGWTLERRGLLRYDEQWRPRLLVAS